MKRIMIALIYGLALPAYADDIFPNGLQEQESYTRDQQAAARLYLYGNTDAEYTTCQFIGYEDKHQDALEALKTTIKESKLPDARSQFTPYYETSYNNRVKEIQERPVICEELVIADQKRQAESKKRDQLLQQKAEELEEESRRSREELIKKYKQYLIDNGN